MSAFLQGPWAIGIFVLLGVGFLYLMYRVWASSTASKGNQSNTGKAWTPGSQQEIPDHRPKPPEPPRKEQI